LLEAMDCILSGYFPFWSSDKFFVSAYIIKLGGT
jgi:hypothetical protein